MALEDLTGTGKFITALNPAWPVDDDWVDEGDNHIRGIKNVLKNTFPGWNGAHALFPDGTRAAPGIAWAEDPDTGFNRDTATGTIESSVNGTMAWSWHGTSFYIAPAVTLNVTNISSAGAISASGGISAGGQITGMGLWSTAGLNVATTGTIGSGNSGVFHVNGGFAGTAATVALAPVRVNSTGGQAAGYGMYRGAGISPAAMWQGGAGEILFGVENAQGPSGLAGAMMGITTIGGVVARSFTNSTLLLAERTEVRELTGALANVLKLRGRRYHNPETGRDEIGLAAEDVALAYPELAGERTIDYMALVAPMVEAIRELSERVVALEAKCAGN